MQMAMLVEWVEKGKMHSIVRFTTYRSAGSSPNHTPNQNTSKLKCPRPSSSRQDTTTSQLTANTSPSSKISQTTNFTAGPTTQSKSVAVSQNTQARTQPPKTPLDCSVLA